MATPEEKAEREAAAQRRRDELAERNRAAEAKRAAQRGDEQLAGEILRDQDAD